MTARRGLSVFLDVNFYDHPKVVAAGERADRLYTEALCLAKRTWSDGFVTEAQVRKMGLPDWQERAAVLVTVGLFTRDDGRVGWWIHDFLEHNRSRSEQEAISAKRADAGRKGGRPRNQVAEQPESKVEASSKPCSDLFCSDLTPPAPPASPASPTGADPETLPEVVGLADRLVETVTVPGELANSYERSLVADALALGHTEPALLAAAAEAAAGGNNPRPYLRGILKRLATEPPTAEPVPTRPPETMSPPVESDQEALDREYAERHGAEL